MEEKPIKFTAEQTEAFANVSPFINDMLQVLRLLYDLRLLPEQILSIRADVVAETGLRRC